MTTVIVGNGIDVSSLNGQDDPSIRQLASEAELDFELGRQDARLLVLGPTLDRPLEIAQRVGGIDSCVAIIIVATPDRLDELRRDMRFMPHLPRDIKFVSSTDALELKETVRQATERARARRRYTELVNAVKLPVPQWRPQTRHYLDNLLTHAPIGVILTNPDSVVLAWNPMASRLTGVSAREILGHPLGALRTCDGCEKLGAVIDSATPGPAKDRTRVCLTFSNGETRHLETTISAVDGGHGDQKGHLILLLDVTERVLAEEERSRMRRREREAERLEELGLLAGGVAHDFNNILVSILGNAQIGLEDVGDDPELEPLFTDIVSAANHASDLTQQMLAYSGRSRFEVRRVDLSELVREVSSLLKSSTAKNVRFQMRLADELLPVEIDVGQLRRVLLNLVTNASDAIGDRQGDIVISSTREILAEPRQAELTGVDLAPGAFACVQVEDTGCGIEPDAMARMFDPFFTTKSTGRGLGLSAVLGIVRSHAGELRVESVVGRGTVFTIRIPLCETIEASNASDSNGPPASGGLILIIDDEPHVMKVAQRVLARRGYDILTADDGTQGLDLIERHPEADMILLDASMPGLTGREILAEMKRTGLRTPVILSSGYDESGATTSDEFPNLRAFLPKPYNIKELPELVASVIGT